MSFAFAAAMAILILIAKVISALHQPPPHELRLLFWLTFVPSTRSLVRFETAGSAERNRALARLGIVMAFSFLMYVLTRWTIRVTGAEGIWLGWLGAPCLWLMGELSGSLLQVFTLVSGRLQPLPHGNVFAARSVGDFWGRRWNVWMSDWFRQIIFLPLQKRPLVAMGIVFFASGIIHEGVINLSFWLMTGRSLFGSMMLYFGLQALGILFERQFLPRHGVVRRVFAWAIVLGPAPLIVNEAILRALQLWW